MARKNRRSTKRNNQKLLYTILSAVLLLLSTVLYKTGLTEDLINTGDSKLYVYCVDVGQGDCELLLCEGKAMLIDGGTESSAEHICNTLANAGVTELAYVAATHAHADHIGGIADVLDVYPAEYFMMPEFAVNEENPPECYDEMNAALERQNIPRLDTSVGSTYSLGSATVTVLGPVDRSEDINNCSLVLRVDHGTNSFLFAGDAGSEEETDMLQAGENLDCDVLKVGHHGSNGSSSKTFLQAVTPRTAVISCGQDNDYGHPGNKALNRLYAYTQKVYRTDKTGDILFTSDGTTVNVAE